MDMWLQVEIVIGCEDLDSINGKETIVRIDDIPYSLIELDGKLGRPGLVPYVANLGWDRQQNGIKK